MQAECGTLPAAHFSDGEIEAALQEAEQLLGLEGSSAALGPTARGAGVMGQHDSGQAGAAGGGGPHTAFALNEQVCFLPCALTASQVLSESSSPSPSAAAGRCRLCSCASPCTKRMWRLWSSAHS